MIALVLVIALVAFAAGWTLAMRYRDRADCPRCSARPGRQPRTAPHWIGAAQ